MVLHYAEENPDEVLAALDDKTEAVIRELRISCPGSNVSAPGRSRAWKALTGRLRRSRSLSVTKITKDSHYVGRSECFAVESSRIAATRRWLLIIDVCRRN